MHSVCFHFQVNQPYILRTYRFFDINQKHDYFDVYQNNYWINRLAERSYLPANQMILDVIEKYGNDVAFSFSISGTTINLFKEYCPEVIDSFKKLIATGRVEITGSTFSHSLAALNNKSTFVEQVKLQEKLLYDTFGVKPTTFCNTEIIYSDDIGEWLFELGYRVVLTEGAKHILGWKNPCYLYCNPFQTEQKLLLRSYQLCDDITLRFSDQSWNEYPLTAEKYMKFLSGIASDAQFINLYFDYETIGDYHTKETGIFDFFHALFAQLAESQNFHFIMPKEALKSQAQASTLHVPWPISCSGDEKDINEWLGNELQQEAFEQLYKSESLYLTSKNEEAKRAWLRMQNALYYHFMGTKWFPQDAVKKHFDVYPSPYQAFINYMNVLNDVKLQLEKS
ncbi:MAG: glycoside hydrolase family 57 protein [Bacteroidetes bacterium]|nr:glycoside hydrolase family 57 protein [Bacteroidota bacterium]MCL2302463.1 glycoside hydrolase family 57 protein [Lentimicrobiaceae bacterium]